MVRLRGRSPLMLVPVHNPQNAAALVQLASVLTPPGVGKVLYSEWLERRIRQRSGNPRTIATAGKGHATRRSGRTLSGGHGHRSHRSLGRVARVAEDENAKECSWD